MKPDRPSVGRIQAVPRPCETWFGGKDPSRGRRPTVKLNGGILAYETIWHRVAARPEGCDLSDLSRKKLQDDFSQLCDLIRMKRHGDPLFWEDHSGIPHLYGVSAIQFIETRNVVCHPLPKPRADCVNVFSCKEFVIDAAKRFSIEYWRAGSVIYTVVTPT